ncbi:MAG: DNA gyrase subunit A, partial [Verrucomicrobia bacterium]|nr:DNA gyrase subunit A [Verrucomicrobiota bacterium]
SPRRTKLVAAEGEFQMEDLIPDEPVCITISTDDYVRRLPIDTFREQRRGGQGVIGMDMRKESDALKQLYVASTHDTLLIFTSHGRCYWVKVWQIPETGRRSKGKPLIGLLEDIREGERIAATLKIRDLNAPGYLLLVTRRGVVKKTELTAFSNPRRKGVFALNIDEGDELIAAQCIQGEQQVMLFTKKGMAVRFDHQDVRPVGRVARGVRGVNLRSEDDGVVGCEVVNGNETILIVCENGFGKKTAVEEFRQTHRGGVGVRSILTSDRNGDVVGALCVSEQDGLVMMSQAGQAVRIGMSDVRVLGRSTQGVKLVNLKNGDVLVGIQRVPAEE